MQLPLPPTLTDALRTRLQGWGGLLVVCAWLYTGVYLAWLVVGWGGEANRELIGNLTFFPAGVAAILLAWRASTLTQLEPSARRAWRLIAGSIALYTLGNLLFLVYDVFLDSAPFPSWADAAYLAAYPVLLWGILSFPTAPAPAAERGTFWLDAGIVFTAGATLLWFLVLRPTAVADYGSWLEAALSLAYPAADLVTLLGVIAILFRTPRPVSQRALLGIAGYIGLNSVADVAYGYLTLQGTYQTGAWPDAFWMLALLVAIISADIQYRDATSRAASPSAARLSRQLADSLPSLAMALMGLTMLLAVRDQLDSIVGQVVLGGVVTAGFVVARQLRAARALRQAQRAAEQAGEALAQANASLEGRVQERTAALAAALEAQAEQARQLAESLAAQQQLAQTIARLSAPIIPVRDDTLVAPLVGALDQERAALLIDELLQRVTATRARQVVFDLTGVGVVDAAVATTLLRAAQAVRLLGANAALSGIRPEVAQLLVTLGADLGALETYATLQEAIAQSVRVAGSTPARRRTT